MDKQVEEWRDIPGYNGEYRVSNKGRVKSIKSGIILRHSICRNGYPVLVLWFNGVSKNHRVHRLVAECFVSNPNNKPQINHKDGNKQNNYAVNLEWLTQSENTKHAFNNGLKKPHDCTGDKNGRAKLTQSDVLEIINLLPTETNTEIAKKYPVTREQVSAIRHKKRWKHLQK